MARPFACTHSFSASARATTLRLRMQSECQTAIDGPAAAFVPAHRAVRARIHSFRHPCLYRCPRALIQPSGSECPRGLPFGRATKGLQPIFRALSPLGP
eukprot:4023889-Alexandrium_andersonii.AAC.1